MDCIVELLYDGDYASEGLKDIAGKATYYVNRGIEAAFAAFRKLIDAVIQKAGEVIQGLKKRLQRKKQGQDKSDHVAAQEPTMGSARALGEADKKAKAMQEIIKRAKQEPDIDQEKVKELQERLRKYSEVIKKRYEKEERKQTAPLALPEGQKLPDRRVAAINTEKIYANIRKAFVLFNHAASKFAMFTKSQNDTKKIYSYLRDVLGEANGLLGDSLNTMGNTWWSDLDKRFNPVEIEPLIKVLEDSRNALIKLKNQIESIYSDKAKRVSNAFLDNNIASSEDTRSKAERQRDMRSDNFGMAYTKLIDGLNEGIRNYARLINLAGRMSTTDEIKK